MCGDCGNCVAVCPTDAIINNRMDSSGFEPIKDPHISYEQFHALVRNRRSIRKFRQIPIQPSHLQNLLQTVRYIPTGSNKQELKYLIITDPVRLKTIKTAMAKKFQLVYKLATMIPFKWFVKKDDQRGLKRLVDLWDGGEDPYLRDTPCLLIVYSHEMYFGISAWDSGIACYNLDLTAQTLGVGTLQNGFFVTTARLFKSIYKLTGLPKKAHILGALCLGYPVVKFRKTVARKPLDIIKLEEEGTKFE
jgi:nitroreductase